MYLPISLINLNVWTANSRVGERIRALAFELGWRVCSFSKSGIKKQAVLPEPIWKHFCQFRVCINEFGSVLNSF